MRRKAICAIVIVFAILFTEFGTTADVDPIKWNGLTTHKRWTVWMIFGNPSYRSYKPVEIKTHVDQLQYGLLLCIDQFNGSYKKWLEGLSFIDGVPESIGEIDFTAGTNHRIYTHRGWNHKYASFENEKSHPDKRRKLLRSIVNYVFDFEKYYENDRAEKMCNAMSCLMYNIHIIEDRYHSEAYYGANSTLLLADASPQTESVIHDITESVNVLFSEQKRAQITGCKHHLHGVLAPPSRYNNTTDAAKLRHPNGEIAPVGPLTSEYV